VPAALLYPLLCSVLRFRRREAMRKKFNYPDKASFSRMTNDDAQAIIQYTAELEFPTSYEMSLQFALFKVMKSQLVFKKCAIVKDVVYRHMVYLQFPDYLPAPRNFPQLKLRTSDLRILLC
jgi:hypothetical protein